MWRNSAYIDPNRRWNKRWHEKFIQHDAGQCSIIRNRRKNNIRILDQIRNSAFRGKA